MSKAAELPIGGERNEAILFEGCKLERENEALRKLLVDAREEGRREGLREAAEMVDEALERAAVLTLKRTAYAPDAEAIRKLKDQS
jgi:hypothetical protein